MSTTLAPTTTYVGFPVTGEEIRGTIRLLGHYRRFLASDHGRAIDPESYFNNGSRVMPDVMTRDQARRRLAFLIHTAINRKAGVPDFAGRKQDPDYQARLGRDCRAVRDCVNRRVIVRRFETGEIRRRYSHLLTDY